MRELVIISFLICLTISGVTQEFEYENLNWKESPKWVALDSSYAEEQEVVLMNEKIIEFAYSEKYEGRLVEYVTIHRIVRVFGDDVIKRNNEVYIGMRSAIELVEAKARVITPDNTIIDFDESNINESKTEDGSGDLKYFAIDGIVKGSDIEYTYTVLRVPSYNGVKSVFQDDVIQTNVSLKLAAPDNLGFAFKSYNGFPEIEKDTTIEEKNVYNASVDSIGKVKNEAYTAYDRSLQYVIFKLDKNYATGKVNIVTFGEVSQLIYSAYYDEIDGASKKKLKKFISESGADKVDSEEQKIRLFETHVKTKLGIIDNVDIKVVKDILTDGYTSEKGITYFTIQGLKMLGIKHELVLTCNRYDDFFDEDFESYQVLKNELIYFPKTKKYMVPNEPVYRLGMFPSSWANQKGLFIKEIKVGDLVTGLGKVKFIKPIDYKLTQDIMNIEVDFSELSQPTVNFKRALSGYSCVYFQSVYNLLDDANKKELDEGLIMFADDNGEIIEYKVSGVANEDIGVSPVVYEGKLKTASIMEKAGNKYLFKVGELIGPQAEMYQEEERVFDVEHDHNKSYQRTIKFEVPEGFEVSGLESLKINEYYPLEGSKILFESDYTRTGNIIEIVVTETYKEMFFSKDEINDFRRIINAAANFNKVVLFINKK